MSRRDIFSEERRGRYRGKAGVSRAIKDKRSAVLGRFPPSPPAAWSRLSVRSGQTGLHWRPSPLHPSRASRLWGALLLHPRRIIKFYHIAAIRTRGGRWSPVATVQRCSTLRFGRFWACPTGTQNLSRQASTSRLRSKRFIWAQPKLHCPSLPMIRPADAAFWRRTRKSFCAGFPRFAR